MRSSDQEKIQNFKTLVIYSTLGIGTATGMLLLGRHFYKKVLTNQSQKNSLDEGNPAAYATQLKMAFDNDNYFGWGTNTKEVNRVFEQIPTKTMYSKVQKEYSRMYNKNLNADLESELSSDEYNALIRLLNTKKK